MSRALVLALVMLVAGCTGTQQPPPQAPAPTSAAAGWPSLKLTEVMTSLDRPLLVTHANDSSGRLFIVEQGGLVLIMKDGALLDHPFLDITSATAAEGERGLLGFAFSPHFATDGRVYASYTDLNGDSTLVRYHVAAAAPDRVDPSSAETLLHVAQPYPNHNGGHIVFGPDGDLYFGLGDGGSAGDPQGNGQNKDVLIGSLLRIDVSGPGGYQIPLENPYAHGGGKAEVWAKGLRNPWRFSFDRATGDLYIGDVGQDAWEEIDYQPRASHGGENYGWNAFEGKHVYEAITRPFSSVTAPVAEYSHAEGGCSVTGGYVYRGAAVPELNGTYVFADYCSGKMWGLRNEAKGWNMTRLLDTGLSVSSFGEDQAGEVYVVDHNGAVYRIDARSSSA